MITENRITSQPKSPRFDNNQAPQCASTAFDLLTDGLDSFGTLTVEQMATLPVEWRKEVVAMCRNLAAKLASTTEAPATTMTYRRIRSLDAFVRENYASQYRDNETYAIVGDVDIRDSGDRRVGVLPFGMAAVKVPIDSVCRWFVGRGTAVKKLRAHVRNARTSASAAEQMVRTGHYVSQSVGVVAQRYRDGNIESAAEWLQRSIDANVDISGRILRTLEDAIGAEAVATIQETEPVERESDSTHVTT